MELILAFVIVSLPVILLGRLLKKSGARRAKRKKNEREKIERRENESAQRDGTGKVFDWTDKDPWDIKRD